MLIYTHKKPLYIFSLFLLCNNYFAQQAISSGSSAEAKAQAGTSTNNYLSTEALARVEQPTTDNNLRFTPNKGQLADMNGNLCPDILYKGEGGGADIYLRKTGISYVYSNMGEVMYDVDKQIEELKMTEIITPDNEQEKKQELMQAMKIKIHRVDMNFAGCNQNVKITNEDEIDGYNNYYYAHCPDGILNVKQYNKVTYKNIYNGIDITYYGRSSSLSFGEGRGEDGIKYDIIVQPHANPDQIKLHWKGAKELKVIDGKLIIKTILNDGSTGITNQFTESIPKVYQVINGEVVDVKARYILNGTMVNFELGTLADGRQAWNPELPLIIDPWATYYGGTSSENGTSVACDNAGSVYLAGITASPNAGNVIATSPGFQTVIGGSWDAFLVKFNSATGTRIWATYYGGTGIDRGLSTTCDNFGHVYLAGYTDSPNVGNVIAPSGNFQSTFMGFLDAFLVQFNSAAGTRIWATYIGGTDDDRGYSVACDNPGNVYLAGQTRSINGGNIMASAGSFQNTLGGNFDAFLVKFSITGARLWATYYGSTGIENGRSTTCDNNGNVYLAGSSNSPNIGNAIASILSHQPVLGGLSDAFLVQFNSFTGARNWATYYGGNGDDSGYSIACDKIGNVFLAGNTQSTNTGNEIATANGHQTVFGGGVFLGVGDAFLVQFNSTNGARNWGTYFGSNLSELTMNGCLATDGNSNVYLYMEVEDAPGPNLIDPCAYQPNFAGGIEDQMIVKFNSIGKKLCATYFGGTGYEDLDEGGGIAVAGNLLFICAFNGNGVGVGVGANAGGYPVTPGAWQTVYGGGSCDAVLASLCINICEGKTALGLNFTAATNICSNMPVSFTPTVANSCDTTGYKYHWVFTGGNPATSDSVNPTVTFAGIGTHNVKLIVTTLCKKDSVTKINYITVEPCVTCNLTGQFIKGTALCTTCSCKQWIMINATGGTSPYSYSWPDGYDKRYKNQLCPGAYTIKVTDKNNCSTNITLTAP